MLALEIRLRYPFTLNQMVKKECNFAQLQVVLSFQLYVCLNHNERQIHLLNGFGNTGTQINLNCRVLLSLFFSCDIISSSISH
jgi:hypothetical protein